jgi:hypothetical protein
VTPFRLRGFWGGIVRAKIAAALLVGPCARCSSGALDRVSPPSPPDSRRPCARVYAFVSPRRQETRACARRDRRTAETNDRSTCASCRLADAELSPEPYGLSEDCRSARG